MIFQRGLEFAGKGPLYLIKTNWKEQVEGGAKQNMEKAKGYRKERKPAARDNITKEQAKPEA